MVDFNKACKDIIRDKAVRAKLKEVFKEENTVISIVKGKEK